MQVLQYLDGQKYSSHFDYFHDTVSKPMLPLSHLMHASLALVKASDAVAGLAF